MAQIIINGDNMKFNNKLFALLAIFCLIASAGMACASEEGGYAGCNYYENEMLASQSSVDLADGVQYIPDGPEPGAGLPLENQTADGPMTGAGNQTGHASGSASTNLTANATASATANVTENATPEMDSANATSELLSTGHPIMIMLGILALIGGYGVFLRRNM